MQQKHISTVLLAATLFFSWGTTYAQKTATPEEQAEKMKKYEEMARPGPEHQRLAELSGNWNYTVNMWMSPSSPNPMVTEGKGTARMVIGGRFLELTSNGTYMGIPFEGLSYIGFDRRNKEYTTVGFDNSGTYWVTAKGQPDSTGVIVMQGKDEDKSMDMTQEYKFLMDIRSKDIFIFSVIFTDAVMSQGTGNFKMMEITYNRAK